MGLVILCYLPPDRLDDVLGPLQSAFGRTYFSGLPGGSDDLLEIYPGPVQMDAETLAILRRL